MFYSGTSPTRALEPMILRNLVVVVRWVLVAIAVVVWLLLIPLIELVSFLVRSVARAPGVRRLRRRGDAPAVSDADRPLELPVAPPPTPIAKPIRDRRAG